MKTFTHYPPRVYLRLILKIIIGALWLLCIASAAFSSPVNKLAGPTLGQNPASVTVCSGSTVAFTVGSVSSGATTKWQVSVNGGSSYTDVPNAAPYTASTITLTITGISTTLNGNMYRLVATDANGTTTSSGATVTVHASPSVSSATHATSICEGATGAGLAVDNDATLSYQWQVSTNNGASWSNINPADGYTGSTTNDLTYPAATLAMNGYLFRYVDTIKATGCYTTSIALDTLHVLSKPAFPSPGYPTPISATICPGDNTSFTAAPTGAATLAYQWQIKFLTDNTWTDVANDAVYSGATTNTLKLTSFIPAAASNNRYSVRLIASYPSTLGCASASNPGTLIVRTLPAVTLQPKDTSVCANSAAGFKVTSSGSAVLSYQWQTDNGTNAATWSNVTGVASTAATLNLGLVTSAMNGYKYRVIVSNACSPPATSDPKTLTVITGGVCTVLPLQLQSFSVQKTGDAEAGISWKIDPQYAVKYFSVQRSADGTHYMSIGQVNGETGKTSYGFTDNTPGSGTIYYRLQITGANDEIVISPVQTLQMAVTMAQLRPSVTTASSTSIYISLAQQSDVSIYLTDITGQVRLRQTTSLNRGKHQLPLSIGGLGKGVYYVHVSDGKGNTNVLTLMKH
jgi:hypothetical protein